MNSEYVQRFTQCGGHYLVSPINVKWETFGENY